MISGQWSAVSIQQSAVSGQWSELLLLTEWGSLSEKKLLVPKALDRVEAGGAHGGENTENKTYSGRGKEAGENGPERNLRGK